MSADRSRPTFELGLLDFWPTVGDTIELAVQADQLGYARYWLTEHPPQPSPQMLLGILGGLTHRIRIGTAGILAHFHNPLRTALDFQLLEVLYPGRIDLGFCGGIAVEPVARALLAGGPDSRTDPALFARKCADLVHFARREFPAGHEYAEVPPWPLADGCPEIWSLGTGPRSAVLAAETGLAFGYSLFHRGSRDDVTTVGAYREAFRPHATRPAPLVSIAIAGTCAESENEARHRAARHTNALIVPNVVGSPRQCAEQIAAIAERYGADVVAFLDVATSLEERLESATLLAEACELRGESAAPETEAAAIEAEQIKVPAELLAALA